MCVRVCVCMRVYVCACACARCMRVRACACVRARVRTWASACMRDVFAIYDNNISPRMIMMIIKIIILYFMQIRHTGIRLVYIKQGFAFSMLGVRGHVIVLHVCMAIYRCCNFTKLFDV